MSRKTLASVLCVLLIVASLLVHLLVTKTTVTGRWIHDRESPVLAPQVTEVPEGQGPRNSTLGFHKIFYLSLPE